MKLMSLILLLCSTAALCVAGKAARAHRQNEEELADLGHVEVYTTQDQNVGEEITHKEIDQDSSEDHDDNNHARNSHNNIDEQSDADLQNNHDDDDVEESNLEVESDELDDGTSLVGTKQERSVSTQRLRRCSYWKSAYYKQKKSTNYYNRLYRSYYGNYLRYYRLYKSYSRYYSSYYKKNRVCQNKYNTLRKGYMNTLATYKNIIKTCKYHG